QVNPEIQAEISTPQGPVKLNIKKTGEKTQVNAESKKRIKVVILLENGKKEIVSTGKLKILT
ncbi:MAG: hypothetical protein N2115_04570, partial [bacterium]|nr:hypothetical protein [bacterium]